MPKYNYDLEEEFGGGDMDLPVPFVNRRGIQKMLDKKGLKLDPIWHPEFDPKLAKRSPLFDPKIIMLRMVHGTQKFVNIQRGLMIKRGLNPPLDMYMTLGELKKLPEHKARKIIGGISGPADNLQTKITALNFLRTYGIPTYLEPGSEKNVHMDPAAYFVHAINPKTNDRHVVVLNMPFLIEQGLEIHLEQGSELSWKAYLAKLKRNFLEANEKSEK